MLKFTTNPPLRQLEKIDFSHSSLNFSSVRLFVKINSCLPCFAFFIYFIRRRRTAAPSLSIFRVSPADQSSTIRSMLIINIEPVFQLTKLQGCSRLFASVRLISLGSPTDRQFHRIIQLNGLDWLTRPRWSRLRRQNTHSLFHFAGQIPTTSTNVSSRRI